MPKLLKNKLVSIFLSILSSLGLVTFLAYATSIGNSVTVTTDFTVNGNATLGDAVADSITANGYFTQVRIGTGSTFEDIGAVGADELGVEGAMEVDGVSYLDGGLITAASSTHSTGVLNVGSASLGVATSTPRQELGIVGSAIFEEASGTTTLFTNSVGSGVGSCIQLRGTGGAMVRLYATTVPATVPTIAYGYAAGLVVENGVCQ